RTTPPSYPRGPGEHYRPWPFRRLPGHVPGPNPPESSQPLSLCGPEETSDRIQDVMPDPVSKGAQYGSQDLVFRGAEFGENPLMVNLLRDRAFPPRGFDPVRGISPEEAPFFDSARFRGKCQEIVDRNLVIVLPIFRELDPGFCLSFLTGHPESLVRIGSEQSTSQEFSVPSHGPPSLPPGVEEPNHAAHANSGFLDQRRMITGLALILTSGIQTFAASIMSLESSFAASLARNSGHSSMKAS